MWTIGPLGFTAPWLLLGLIILPILWLLLRAVPPAPIRRLFPGVALLLGLADDETQTDRTPWWLLLLRILGVAAAIIGFAGPVLNPQAERAGTGPLLVLVDGTWADARDWSRRVQRIEVLLDEASAGERPVAVVLTTDLPAGDLAFQSAEAAAARLPGLSPNPWTAVPEDLIAWIEGQGEGFETFWLSDGLDHGGREDVLGALEAQGSVTVFESPRPIFALRPPEFVDGTVEVTVLRPVGGDPEGVNIVAYGFDPAGNISELATERAPFDPGATEAVATYDLPAELRNRITRFEVEGLRSAGAVTLADDGLRRREVALLSGGASREGLELLSPLHFLEQALSPSADLVNGALTDMLLANPDVLILADVARLADGEADAIQEWVEAGGLLLRFAGPRLAASDISRTELDPLMPVRLRAGGRSVGGAMSWGEPKALEPFGDTSPFFGLTIPEDVTVTAQVVAQPGPDLSDRVIARLTDGTPLVTRRNIGEGSVVLFHVTANTEWSNLPLSGLFVEMLERLSVSTRPSRPSAEELAGTTWVPDEILTGFGAVTDAGNLPGVDGETLATGIASAEMPPGLYTGEDRRIAVNALTPEATLTPTTWPDRIPVEGLAVSRTLDLKGILLALTLLILLIDAIAALWLSGKLRGPRSNAPASAALILLAVAFWPTGAAAQEAETPQDTAAQEAADQLALAATAEVVLAHVITGDPTVDEVALAGLQGLSLILYQRTSIEPGPPVSIDLERDEIAFFPMLYWPITADMPTPSREAYAKLNRFLRNGGMIVFDTRDAELGGFGSSSPESRRLQAIARPLDIPPLEPVPGDHILTRTFYLLQDFPGRYARGQVWVEASPPDAEQAEGMPFRNLNDNVTPVVIGANDWAAAWAINRSGAPMLPVGRGTAGERQREMARRFGVNLVMNVLTGNYKSDQVHVPRLLELGQ